MKIKQGLVYHKHSEHLIGFVAFDEITNHLLDFERSCSSDASAISQIQLASHMLVLLLRGVATNLNFPYAQFITNGISGYQLYVILTEAVMRLEFLGLKVIALTSNGASPNRKLYKLLQGTTPKTKKKRKKCGQPTNDKQSPNLTYNFRNPFTSDDRSVYLVSDVPHLLKTTHNC